MILGWFLTSVVIVGFIGAIAEIIRQKMLPPEQQFNGPRPPQINPGDIVADAKSLEITTEEIQRILRRRFPYYNSLNAYQQVRFVGRTMRFIQNKLFIIKEGTGYREMPVLTSAAAVQLTFGLDDFLLPWFRYIQVYPAEFLSRHELKILVGNVSNRTITVAWTHFLKGYEDGTDGSNVALHEMSHALYYQKVEVEKLDAMEFCSRYEAFTNNCELPLRFEKNGKTGLYTEYGTSNMQEFWAESIELFFERSLELKKAYPKIFQSLTLLLNQDPLTSEKVRSYSIKIIFHQFIGTVWRWQRRLFGYPAT